MSYQTPTGELADKLSILQLKQKRSGIPLGSDLMQGICSEIEQIRELLVARGLSEEFVATLEVINGEIWDLESGIRALRDTNVSENALTEIGRTALNIRRINTIRVEVKNLISQLFGGFREIKASHSSERTD